MPSDTIKVQLPDVVGDDADGDVVPGVFTAGLAGNALPWCSTLCTVSTNRLPTPCIHRARRSRPSALSNVGACQTLVECPRPSASNWLNTRFQISI